MATRDGTVLITTEELNACRGAYQDLAIFAIVSDTPSETLTVTYQIVEPAVGRAAESDPDDTRDDGGRAP